MEHNYIELELRTREPIDIGEFSYEFIDISLLYSKLALLSQGKYEELYNLNGLPYRRRFSEFSRDEKLFILSISKNSPIKVKLGAWLPKAIEAFAELIERISQIPEKKEYARLNNEARKIEIAIEIVDKLDLNKNNCLSKSQRIALANELLHDIANVSGRKKQIRVLDVSSNKNRMS